MRDYGKVATRFWTHGSGKRLRGHPDAQVVAMYLLSGSASTMTGLYYVPLVLMAHETGLTLDAVREALRIASEKGFASYDEERELAWVHNAAEFEFGAGLKLGDNKVKGIAKHLAGFGLHPFVKAFIARYGGALKLFEAASKGLIDPSVTTILLLDKAPSKGLPEPREGAQNQDPDPEQDPEQEQDCDRKPPPPDPVPTGDRLLEHAVSNADGRALIERWQVEREGRGKPRTLITPESWLLTAKEIIARCGGLAKAKLVVSAYVRSDREFWLEAEWPLSMLTNNRDFERAVLLVGGDGKPKTRRQTQGEPRVPARYDVDLAAETRALMAEGGGDGHAAK